MNIRRAFTFVFEDPQWARKIGIAVFLSVVPALLGAVSALQAAGAVTAPAVLGSPLFAPVSSLALVPINGFVLRITRDVANGFDVPLPAWSDFRTILRDGAKLWAIMTVLSLPGIANVLIDQSFGDEPMPVIQGLGAILGLAALLIVFVQPAAVAWLATTDSLSAGLNVRAVLGTVRRNVGGYVLVILVATAAFVVGAALSAGLIWPFWQGIGRSLARHDGATFFAIVNGVWLLVFAPYLRCVEHHLYGQAFVRANR